MTIALIAAAGLVLYVVSMCAVGRRLHDLAEAQERERYFPWSAAQLQQHRRAHEAEVVTQKGDGVIH